MNLEARVNLFFHSGKAFFKSVDEFKASLCGSFYRHIFGDLIYTENKTHSFIGVDRDGTFYDEIYYPTVFDNRVGTLIPKVFYESDLPLIAPDPIWKSVARNGYAELENLKMPEDLKDKALGEAFIPFGFTEGQGCSKSFSQAYFFAQGNYDIPEQHKSPAYLDDVTEHYLNQIPKTSSLFQKYTMHTADLVKYYFDESDLERLDPPNIFHMDYFPRCMFMFFIYFSKTSPIYGRELGVGVRGDFTIEDHNKTSIFDEKIYDESKIDFVDLPIADGKVILMNTLNPIFMHRVNKLRAQNEVTLITNYFWCKKPDIGI